MSATKSVRLTDDQIAALVMAANTQDRQWADMRETFPGAADLVGWQQDLATAKDVLYTAFMEVGE